MKKIMMVAVVGVAASALFAQKEDVKVSAGKQNVKSSAEVATKVPAGAALEVAAAATEDGGAAIIAQAEANAGAVAALPKNPRESALNKVNEELDVMGLSSGYDAKKKAIIQIAAADMEIADPANDSEFMKKREQIGNYAILQAKADVIRAIYTDFSAMDRALLEFDEENDEMAAKFQAVKEAVENKRAELAAAIAEYNKDSASAINNVSLNDRFGSFVAAVVQEIDKAYTPESIAAAKKIDIAAAKKESKELKDKALALLAEYKNLEAAAAKLPKKPVLSTETTASMLSKMPLLGATVLTQAESWDPETKQYSVAVAIVWSFKLQSNVAKIGVGDFSHVGKPGKYSKKAWVKAQDLSSMIGTRRFVDNEGQNYFVGIGAAELRNGVHANEDRKAAESLASKNVVMALIGDLVACREMKQSLKVYADQSTATKQKLADLIASKCDIQLPGCADLAKKEVKHPITGKRIYVAVYYIDPQLAKEAKNSTR